jgi:D-threo-aldose 1-dehydrogenase
MSGNALAKRAIGKTRLEVGTLGFGGAGIGNLYRVLRDEDASAAVTESFATGVRYFDTAPFYGFGLSELRIGTALRGAQPLPVISTKVGRRLVPTGPQDETVGREGYFSSRPFAPVFDYGYDSVMRSHAESLERLGVARVDILLCHDIGRLTHGEAHAARIQEFLEGGYRAMRELRDSGAVTAIGLGVNEWEVCVELLAHCELDCLLLAGRYTLLEQPALEKLLPLCVERNVSVICGGPFNSGILAAGSGGGGGGEGNHTAPPTPSRRLTTITPRHPRPCSSAFASSKRYATPSPFHCRQRRCSFRWRIRPSRAWSQVAPTATKRGIAPACFRMPSRGNSGSHFASAGSLTPRRRFQYETGRMNLAA